MLQAMAWSGSLQLALVPMWFGEAVVGWVGELLVAFGAAIRSAVFEAAVYLADWAVDLFITPVVEAAPGSVSQGFTSVRPWMDAANAWAPVSEWLLMLGAYVGIWSLFVVTKLVLKAIPTVG